MIKRSYESNVSRDNIQGWSFKMNLDQPIQNKVESRLYPVNELMKSISNAGLVNKFRNICGGGGRNWQRDGFGWVTRQGLVWLAQGGGLRVHGDRGRDG